MWYNVIAGGFMIKEESLKKFVEDRPKIVYAFSYSPLDEKIKSFKQTGSANEKTKPELILGVDGLREFHKENLKHYPFDYTKQGANLIYNCEPLEQLKGETGITYQIGEIDGESIRYGVMDRHDLEEKLLTWKNVSVPEIFGKQFHTIKSTSSFNQVIEQTRKSTLLAALYCLKPGETSYQLYRDIVNFSIVGTPKMRIFRSGRPINEVLVRESCGLVELYQQGDYFKIESGIVRPNWSKLIEEPFPAYLANALKNTDRENVEEMRRTILEYFKEENKKEYQKQKRHDRITCKKSF